MQNNVTILETAMRLLEQTLKKAPGTLGDEAKSLAWQVREQKHLVEHATEAVRGETFYNPRANYAVKIADRVVSEAEETLEQLDKKGRYTGPRWSLMSVAEKADYIRQHGEQKFLALPW
jgi:hypothetical protein